jgi:putative Mg2+ transporter-C (MgtC) family protein
MITDLEVILRLVLASFLGGIVGLEREVHGRPAGVRTYLLLSLGSALIMVMSEYLFLKYKTGVPGLSLSVDPGRIAAQAVTGIGFLGAGVIIRYKDSVRGLTTAACVWVVCAVGLAVGAGFYLYGSVVTGFTLLSLLALKLGERRLRKDWYREIEIVSADLPGQMQRFQDVIEQHQFEVVNFGLKRDLEKQEMTASFLLRERTLRPGRQVLQEIFEMEGVRKVDLG